MPTKSDITITQAEALKSLTPKQAWATVYPLIHAETIVSFNLQVTQDEHGRSVIHAARNKVFINETGGLSLDDESSNSFSHANRRRIAVVELLLSSFGLTNHKTNNYPIDARIVDYIECRYNRGWEPGYAYRAQRRLMWAIMTQLPGVNRRIAYASGCVLFADSLLAIQRINIIARHRDLLERVYSDDRRLLSTVIELLRQKHVFAGPDTAIKEVKDLLIADGLSESGWRRFVKLSPVEKQGWLRSLLECPPDDDPFIVQARTDRNKTIVLLNLIAKKQINIRIYDPSVFFHWLTFDVEPSAQGQHLKNVLFVLEVVLHEAVKVQKGNKGRLSSRLLLSTIKNMRDVFDFVNAGTTFVAPRGAGYHWLKRQADNWHIEVANRAIDQLTQKEDWRDSITSQFLEIKRDDGLVATILTSTVDFYRESQKMHHCVSGRWEVARNGWCYVYHLYDGVDDTHATLDLRKNKQGAFELYECRSYCNAKTTSRLTGFANVVVNYFNSEGRCGNIPRRL